MLRQKPVVKTQDSHGPPGSTAATSLRNGLRCVHRGRVRLPCPHRHVWQGTYGRARRGVQHLSLPCPPWAKAPSDSKCRWKKKAECNLICLRVLCTREGYRSQGTGLADQDFLVCRRVYDTLLSPHFISPPPLACFPVHLWLSQLHFHQCFSLKPSSSRCSSFLWDCLLRFF